MADEPMARGLDPQFSGSGQGWTVVLASGKVMIKAPVNSRGHPHFTEAAQITENKCFTVLRFGVDALHNDAACAPVSIRQPEPSHDVAPQTAPLRVDRTTHRAAAQFGNPNGVALIAVRKTPSADVSPFRSRTELRVTPRDVQ
jgi:hypothetical protein